MIDSASLIKWVADLVPTCKVSNLSWNWSDGVLLASICTALRPDDIDLILLPANVRQMAREEACSHAMAMLRLCTGVAPPPGLTPADVALALNPSALATYVARLRAVATGNAPLPPMPAPTVPPSVQVQQHVPPTRAPYEPPTPLRPVPSDVVNQQTQVRPMHLCIFHTFVRLNVVSSSL